MLKTENNTNVISNIAPIGDSKKEKPEAVSQLLVDICGQKEIPMVDHGNINTKIHFKKADYILMLMVNLLNLLNLKNLKILIDGASGITNIKQFF